MTKERMKLVEPILNTFENDDIKEFAIVLLDNLPEYIWSVPAEENVGRRDVLDAIAACKKKAEEKIEADDDIDL